MTIRRKPASIVTSKLYKMEIKTYDIEKVLKKGSYEKKKQPKFEISFGEFRNQEGDISYKDQLRERVRIQKIQNLVRNTTKKEQEK